MKIKQQQEREKRATFIEVKIGQVFDYRNTGSLWMRVDDSSPHVNVVNVESGYTGKVLDHEEVKIYPDATLLLEGE